MFRVDLFAPTIISPLRTTLLAVAAFGLYAFHRHYGLPFIIASAACLAAAVFGYSTSTIRLGIEHLGQLALSLAWRSVPRTTLQWGCTAIATAFVLLGAGAVLSRHKLTVPAACDAPPADDLPTT